MNLEMSAPRVDTQGFAFYLVDSVDPLKEFSSLFAAAVPSFMLVDALEQTGYLGTNCANIAAQAPKTKAMGAETDESATGLASV